MFRYDEYCIDGEAWKPIPRYEGLYEASSLGRIRSVDGKKTHTKRHGVRVWKGRILHNKTKIPQKEGYKVDLWKNGKPQNWILARLVCMAFHGDVEFKNSGGDRITVNHKDGNRFNNKPENLEWMTMAENVRHAFENDFIPQKHIALINGNGVKYSFRSMSAASRYIGRSNGYISLAVSKNRMFAKAINGEVYYIDKGEK